MARILERVTQQRYRNLAEQNGFRFFFSDIPRIPKITYGRKDTKALSLTAKQFRAYPYAIPSDGGNDEPASAPLCEATSSEDSELSDAEPVIARTRHDTLKASKPRYGSSSRRINQNAVSRPSKRKKSVAKPIQTSNGKVVKRRKMPSITVAETKSKRKSVTPARRLRTHELFLVSSPVDYAQNHDPVSSVRGPETQDPNVDQSSSPTERRTPLISSDVEEGTPKHAKTSRSAIRKRLHSSRCRYKSISPPKRKPSVTNSMWMTQVSEPGGRDGFNDTELAIPPHIKTRQNRKRKDPLIARFDALELRSGPLPKVDFDVPPTQLKMETAVTEADECALLVQEQGVGLPASAPDSAQRSKRGVSFSDRSREELIRAQLSSISAPERVSSESEESGDDPDEEVDVTEDEGFQCNEVSSIYGDEPRTDEEVQETSNHINPGVTLDFRQNTALTQRPTTSSLRRRALIEVNEAIVEVPDSDSTHIGYTLDRHDVPDQSLPDQRQHRPRSILKNSTPPNLDSVTGPEETIANTRRNSIVEVVESRYFTNAANLLRAPDPNHHRIIPRRRSSYFDVQVPDTDGVVPETSLEPLDYTNKTQLNVLRGSTETVWISSSVPTAPKDLKALTRTVSREHGALSQSVRRRPSLPFLSPTKVT